jgi:hypothetical protein
MQFYVVVRCANPGRDKGFVFFLENAHTGCGVHTAFYILGNWGLFVSGAGVKNCMLSRLG